MQFDVLTLFPEMFDILNESIIGRAKEKGLINVNLINIRDFSKNKHKKVDDTPYGGGAGMVIQPDVVYDAYKSVIFSFRNNFKEVGSGFIFLAFNNPNIAENQHPPEPSCLTKTLFLKSYAFSKYFSLGIKKLPVP